MQQIVNPNFSRMENPFFFEAENLPFLLNYSQELNQFQKKYPDKEVVYFIQSGGLIKIGYSSNLKNRVKTYETQNPHIIVKSFLYANQEIEKKFHKMFYYFLAARKEWFYLQPPLSYFIDGRTDTLEYYTRKHCHEKPPTVSLREINGKFYISVSQGKKIKRFSTGINVTKKIQLPRLYSVLNQIEIDCRANLFDWDFSEYKKMLRS